MLDKHTIKIIMSLVTSCLAIVIIALGLKNCIYHEYNRNEYGVPMIIEDGCGNKYEYIRPVQEGDILLRNPLSEQTKIVYENWWYVKLDEASATKS